LNPLPKTDIAPALVLPAREPFLTPIPLGLDKRVRDAMRAGGYDRLFSHQADALGHLLADRNVVLATGTGSGKSLVYWSFAAHRIVQEPMARVLAIFPTKALAQDQLKQFESWIPSDMARIGVLDADTKRSHRAAIRQSSHVIVTNPDMLHVGILPNHESWSKFLRSLRLIVVDELHSYTGVFGAHVAGIMRRLLRLTHWHGAHPVIASASATILEPTDHARHLTGQQFVAVTEDGSRKFERTVYVLPSNDLDLRELTSWLGRSIIEGQRTLAFSQSRQAAEWLTIQTRDYLSREGYPAAWVDTYRSGLTAKDRRKIESDIRSGRIVGVSATSALELGIDIGDLDRVLLNGYPGSRASFWQQIGRVGRSRSGEAYYLPRQDALDEYVGRSLGEVRDQPVELAPLALQNPNVVRSQLRCAAFERPLGIDELASWPSVANEVAQDMQETDELVFQAGRLYYPSHTNPAPRISIRGAVSHSIKLHHGNAELGTVERSRALREVHPGAVYLLRGEKYRVTALDLDAGRASLEPDPTAFGTQAILYHGVAPKLSIEERGPFTLAALTATTWITGYRSFDRPAEAIPLDLPSEPFDSIGVVIRLGTEIATGAIHGAEHVLTAAATVITGCHPNDLESTWSSPSMEEQGMLVAFDSAPGGNGIAEAAFVDLERWLAVGISILQSCPCEFGCPACLFSPRCPYSNEHLDKPATHDLLRTWAREI